MIKGLKVISIMLGCALATGCTLTGSDISTYNKNIIEQPDNNYNINKLVDIYPITPWFSPKKMYAAPVVSRNNPELDEKLKNYQYKIGVGDILNITILGAS